jgi:hypothetical protein
MIWVEESRQHSWIGIRDSRPDLFLETVMTLRCTAGIAFYVLFLVALCKERRPRSSGYWMRLRLGSGESTIAELPERTKSVARPA